MDRYQIVLDKRDPQPHRFPSTSSVKTVGRYLDYCIENKLVFSAKNFAAAVVEVALIKISLRMRAPIVVDSEKNAQLFSMTYSHRFYTKDHLIASQVICYNCPGIRLPPGVTALLVVSNI